MLSTRILAELRRRPWTRRVLSLAGYVGGFCITVYGVVLFSVSPGMDVQMAAGWPLVGGFILMGLTAEIREAIHSNC